MPRVPDTAKELLIEGRRLEVAITRNLRATRLTLRIAPGGRKLHLTAPPKIAAGAIDEFLHRQTGWIAGKISKLPANRRLCNGSALPLRGAAHIIRHTGLRRGPTQLSVIDDQREIRVSGDPAHLIRRVADFLKGEARRDLHEAVARHALKIERKPRSVRVRDTVSRWGSCNIEGDLSFSWRIVMAPSFVLDYLAAHEVAHLEEMNHGPKFWALCADLCSDTPKAKAWLKAHGSALHVLEF